MKRKGPCFKELHLGKSNKHESLIQMKANLHCNCKRQMSILSIIVSVIEKINKKYTVY